MMRREREKEKIKREKARERDLAGHIFCDVNDFVEPHALPLTGNFPSINTACQGITPIKLPAQRPNEHVIFLSLL